MDDASNTPKNHLQKDLSAQLAITGASELVGLSVAVGSVWLARKALPGQVEQLEKLFSRWLNKDEATATKAADFLLMNLGGIANMTSQFTLHRMTTPENERLPLGEEALRVATGRAAGTLGAISLVALAEKHGAGTLRRAEAGLERYLPGNGMVMAHAQPMRVAPLIVSSLLQSAGAIGPNALSQVVFDRLVRPCESVAR